MKTVHDWVDQLICGDALQVLSEMPSEFVDAVVTDPPYFLDKLDNQWSLEQVEKRLPSQRVITHLPPGMKFDPNQGREFYRWFLRVAQELFRILKPGGFFFCFFSPRLYHRLAAAVEDAGFWIRDSFIWLYLQNQPKAMGLDPFIERLPVSETMKQQLKAKLRGWKTPQVKSCYEPIVVAQKPYEGTLLLEAARPRLPLAAQGGTL